MPERGTQQPPQAAASGAGEAGRGTTALGRTRGHGPTRRAFGRASRDRHRRLRDRLCGGARPPCQQRSSGAGPAGPDLAQGWRRSPGDLPRGDGGAGMARDRGPRGPGQRHVLGTTLGTGPPAAPYETRRCDFAANWPRHCSSRAVVNRTNPRRRPGQDVVLSHLVGTFIRCPYPPSRSTPRSVQPSPSAQKLPPPAIPAARPAPGLERCGPASAGPPIPAFAPSAGASGRMCDASIQPIRTLPCPRHGGTQTRRSGGTQ